MKTPVSSKPRSTLQTSVIKVERDGQRAIAYSIRAGQPIAVRLTLRKVLKPSKRRADPFASPTLRETLSEAFREAVRSAHRRYG